MVLWDAFKSHMNERKFLVLSFIIISIFILLLTDLNSINPDETSNIFIGKSILSGSYGDTGSYFHEYSHRPPLIPSIVAVSIYSGLGINFARMLIPILFMNALVLATFIFIKKLYGIKAAYISTLLLMTFPFFWRWGLSILTDVPFAAVSTGFLLFSYITIEHDRKMMPLASLLFVAGLMLKTTMLVFILPIFLYIIIYRKYSIIISKDFLISLSLFFVIFFGTYEIFNIFTGAVLNPLGSVTFLASEWNITELLKLAFSPWLILSFPGIAFIILRHKKEDVFLLLNLVLFTGFFIATGHLRLRYLIPMIPILSLFAYVGYDELSKRLRMKHFVNAVLIALLIISALNSLYIIHLEESTLWGSEVLTDFINGIEGNVTIATDYHYYYLKSTTDKNLYEIPKYIFLKTGRVRLEEFINVISNVTNPLHDEYFEAKKTSAYYMKSIFEYDWFAENHVNFLVMSVYSDYDRNNVTYYYHPDFALVNVPFISRPYSNGRVPPSYTFSSSEYEYIENDPRFERYADIKSPSGQIIFIIYKIL